MHEIARRNRLLAGPRNVGETAQYLPVGGVQLHVRHPLAKAHMRPVAKGQVILRIRARNVIRIRIVELRRIAIG